MILEADNIELYFKGKAILNGIYFKAETGKITGILGRNGCGKSSLLKIIFGDLKPKYKLIRIDNKPILKPLYKTLFAHYLPQYDFISKTLRLKTIFKLFNVNWYDFIIEFETFSIYQNTRFGLLSSGERRIIEIYIILRTPGKIALLDEPFNGIAPLYIEKIQDLIKREKHQKAIVLTDHRYTEVIDVCDTIYLINHGSTKLVENIFELEGYNYLRVGTLD